MFFFLEGGAIMFWVYILSAFKLHKNTQNWWPTAQQFCNFQLDYYPQTNFYPHDKSYQTAFTQTVKSIVLPWYILLTGKKFLRQQQKNIPKIDLPKIKELKTKRIRTQNIHVNFYLESKVSMIQFENKKFNLIVKFN